MSGAFPLQRLRDVAESIDYGLTASATAENTGNKFLRITDIQDGYVDWSKVPFCDAAENKLCAAILNDGDIVFARTGATTGKSFLVRNPPPKSVFASYLIRVKPSRSIDSSFLSHFFQSTAYWGQIKLKTQGAAQGGVNATSLSSLDIPILPLDEQRRIAAILDNADALRLKRKRALELLDGLTQSIFLEMFGDPIANPNGMPTTCLHDVVSADRKITYGILKPGPDIADGIPYVRVVDIQNSMIDVENLKRTSVEISREYRRSTLKAGDLLISIRGHVGRMAIAPIECAGANITQDTARLAVDGADTEFVKAQLETKAAQDWMARRTKGAAVKGINLGDLKLFPLLLPPLDAQREFSRRIERLRRMTVSANRQLHDLETLIASLYYHAFSGQL